MLSFGCCGCLSDRLSTVVLDQPAQPVLAAALPALDEYRYLVVAEAIFSAS